MDAGGTATTECPPKRRGAEWKHESPDLSRGESQKRWIRYYAAQSLGCANREESPNEKPDQHPWSKVWNTHPQQEREDKSQNHHIGQRIQERPEKTKNRIPVPDLEVLLSKHHHNIKVVTDAASRRHLAPLVRTCGCRNSLRGNNDCCIRHMLSHVF